MPEANVVIRLLNHSGQTFADGIYFPREPVAGWQVGDWSYPRSVTKRLSFQGQKLKLYEGRLSVAAKVKPVNTVDAAHLIPVVLTLQACDDRICLPPETRVLQIPVHR